MRSNQQPSTEIELPSKIGNIVKRFVSFKKTLICCFTFLIIGGGRIQWDKKAGQFNCEVGGIPGLLKEYNNYLNDQNKRELLKYVVEKSKELDVVPSNITLLKPNPQ